MPPNSRLNGPKKQRKRYSGKKKRHTQKVQVIVDQKPASFSRPTLPLAANMTFSCSNYDEATGLLEKRKQLADFQDTRDIFYSNVRVFASK